MGKKVLIVEDNRVTLDFLAKTIRKMGHRVTCARDGLEALDTLTGFTPDIIFLDLIIPKIGGDKLCKIMRKMQHLGDCTIVIISAVAAEMKIGYAELGADLCIAKGPFGRMAEHVAAVLADLDRPGSGDPAGIIGLEELTHRQPTRELVSKSDHLETLLESISEGIIEVYSNRVVYANAGALQLFGLSEENLLGSFFLDLLEEKIRSRVKPMLQSGSDLPEEIGLKRPIEINGRLVTIKKLPVRQQPATNIIMITDVTRRTQLEMHLQHVQRLDAVGTLAGGVAHNFRNTLAGILVNNQIIQMRLDENTEIFEETRRIDSAVKKGVQLTESLLQFSYKQKAVSFQRFDFRDEITETLRLISGLFSSHIQISVDMEVPLPVFGDPLSLSQALMNLCTNARDSMPDGGLLTIRGHCEGDRVVISVADSGHGMDSETREKCFNPFFTTKAPGKGTGLGLSTTYGIIKNHGGDIEVSSEVNRGAVFRMILPRGAKPAARPPRPAAEIIPGKDQKVLVVDNDADIAEAMFHLIRSIGYRTAVAGSAEDAMRKYRSWQPDIVVLNANMPNMEGIACIEGIAANDADAKIIVVSGYRQQETIGVGRRDKKIIRGYLTKPVGIYELSALLAQSLKRM